MITNKGELLYNHLGEWNVYITETFQFDLNEVMVKKRRENLPRVVHVLS